MLDSALKDIRYSVRNLLKNPGVATVAIITLAFGIGANTAVFSVSNAILLRSLPFDDPGRIVMIWANNSRLKLGVDKLPAPPPDFIDWKEQNTVFETMAVFRTSPYNLTGTGDPERVGGVQVSLDFFSVLGVQPARGRMFASSEDRIGNEHVVALSNGFWKRRFASDPEIIGKTIMLNGEAYTVVAVMPEGFEFPQKAQMPPYLEFPSKTELWTPLAFSENEVKNRNAFHLSTIARLKPGVTLQQSQANMSTVAAAIDEQYRKKSGFGVSVLGIREQLVGDIRLALLVLLVAVGLLLLIACANIANLLLARSIRRQRELVIRTAMGASRARLIRQLIIESVVLAIIGGALGLLIAGWGTNALLSISSDNILRVKEVSIDLRVLTFTFGLTLLTGILSGIAPALQVSKAELNSVLKEEGRGSIGGAASRRVRNLLVVSEVGLALILLIGAGLLIKSYIKLQRVTLGFNPSNVLTMRISLPDSKYPSENQQRAFFLDFLQRVATLPGVESAATVTNLPLTGAVTTTSFTIEGRPAPSPGQEPVGDYTVVSPDFFKVMTIPVLRGRPLTEQEAENSLRVMVINETMAKRFWPNEDPIGKHVSVNLRGKVDREIVGIVGDVRRAALDAEPRPEMYVSSLQNPNRMVFLVARTTSDPLKMVSAIRNKLQAIDADQPVYEIKSMEQVIADSVFQRRFNMLLLGVFAGLAFILAIIGVYGVIAYLANQRTHEIGIRMALGAQKTDILKLIIGQGMALALIGVAGGLCIAFGLTRILSTLLYQTSASDLSIFFGASVTLLIVALLAVCIPALNAARGDPVIALRE